MAVVGVIKGRCKFIKFRIAHNVETERRVLSRNPFESEGCSAITSKALEHPKRFPTFTFFVKSGVRRLFSPFIVPFFLHRSRCDCIASGAGEKGAKKKERVLLLHAPTEGPRTACLNHMGERAQVWARLLVDSDKAQSSLVEGTTPENFLGFRSGVVSSSLNQLSVVSCWWSVGIVANVRVLPVPVLPVPVLPVPIGNWDWLLAKLSHWQHSVLLVRGCCAAPAARDRK